MSPLCAPQSSRHWVARWGEHPVQLLKETRTPIPATAQHGKRVDYEYERAGTANIFMFTEPLAGWREAAVRETKTKLDWATETARRLEGRYRSTSAAEARTKPRLTLERFTPKPWRANCTTCSSRRVETPF